MGKRRTRLAELRVRAPGLCKKPIEFQRNGFGAFVSDFCFPARRLLPTETLFGCMRLLPKKAEHLVPPGPFRRQVAEASDAHAVGDPAIDGRFDQIRRQESKRDCHVDLSRAAVCERQKTF